MSPRELTLAGPVRRPTPWARLGMRPLGLATRWARCILPGRCAGRASRRGAGRTRDAGAVACFGALCLLEVAAAVSCGMPILVIDPMLWLLWCYVCCSCFFCHNRYPRKAVEKSSCSGAVARDSLRMLIEEDRSHGNSYRLPKTNVTKSYTTYKTYMMTYVTCCRGIRTRALR